MHKAAIMTALVALMSLTALAKDMTPDEIQYKADFIIKIIDYITWPVKAGNAEGQVAIGVVGESPLTPKLRELAAAASGGGSKITVTTVSPDSDLTAYQILFLTTEDKTALAKILKKVENSPVLTISDAYYFARHGVMVNFYSEEVDGKVKVKFEVNQITLGMAGLKMSSKLLKLATLI